VHPARGVVEHIRDPFTPTADRTQAALAPTNKTAITPTARTLKVCAVAVKTRRDLQRD
jgi:hypothetical protein